MQQKNARYFAAVCERIRTVAAEKNLSSLDLARSAEVSYRTVFAVMKGEARLQDRIIGKLAHALGVSVEYLMSGNQSAKAINDHKPVWEVKEPKRPVSGVVANAVAVLAEHFGMDEKTIMEFLAEHIAQRRNGAMTPATKGEER